MTNNEQKSRPFLADLVEVSRGDREGDLLLRNGVVLNLFTGELLEQDILLLGSRIAWIGRGRTDAKHSLDLGGAIVLPGFIDAHIHIESTLLTPPEFARVAVPHGTTTVVADPHEIVNVLGSRGYRYMVSASRGLPLEFRYMIPSCVPATHLESGGSELSLEEMETLLQEEPEIGLAEMMNFPGVVVGDINVLRKLDLAQRMGRPIDGHAPGLSGSRLQAYIAAGVETDHECTNLEEAREKLRAGMRILIREGTVEKNMESLFPLLNDRTADRIALVSDDRAPGELLREGHMDRLLRKIVSLGLDPVTAVRLVTLNPAQFYGMERRGGVAPGWRADLVVVDTLQNFRVLHTVQDGRLVASAGQVLCDIPRHDDISVLNTIHIGPKGGDAAGETVDVTGRAVDVRGSAVDVRGSAVDVRGSAVDVIAGSESGSLAPHRFRVKDEGCEVRVIGIVPDQIVTREIHAQLPAREGYLAADTDRDILRLAVVERHHATGHMGLGWVQGIGLREGAIASSVSHDSHNIVVAGVDEESMSLAVDRIRRMGGGFVAVSGKRSKEGELREIAGVALPVAGLMSEEPADALAAKLEDLLDAVRRMGGVLANPFFALSFLALPVVPEIKLTDRGLVDVNSFRHVSMYVEDRNP